MRTSRLSMIRRIFWIFKTTMALALFAACSNFQNALATPDSLVNAKDMFYQELKGGGSSTSMPSNSGGASSGKGTTIAYCLELHRGSAQPVLCNNRYSFHSGDGLRLHVKSSTSVYCYVGLIQGSSGKKSVLLYPNSSSDNNHIDAGKECMVPPVGMIVFDNTPGTEQLGVIFSQQPLEAERALGSKSIPIDSNSLTGIPQKVGKYSVYSSDGVYDLGVKAPGNGLVYVNNPDPNKPTVIAIALGHGSSAVEPPASPPSSSTPPSSPPPSAPRPPRPSSNHHSSSTASSATSDSAGNRAITDKWAFIVGLNHFANFPNNSLRYCVADATALRDFLVNEAGFKANHVYLLTDEQATTANIKRVMTELLPRAIRKEDLVLLYFSTHGTPEMKGDNYIVTYDFDGSGTTGIPMSTMSSMIKTKIPSDRVVTMIDTCFSGSAKPLFDDPEKRIDDVLTGCGQLILTACNSQETSLEDAKLQHGYFTYYLIDSLRKQRKIISSFDLTKDLVQSHTQSEHGHAQHPVLKKYWTGNDVPIFAQPTSPRN